MGVKIFFDVERKKQEYAEKTKKAQKVLDQVVLTDSNFFCPEKDSHLMKSGIAKTVIGSGLIVWQTDYARKQYYEFKRKSHLKNPNATYKWFATAKSRYKKKWVEMVKNEYNRNT